MHPLQTTLQKSCYILLLLMPLLTGCFETPPPFTHAIEVKAADSGRPIPNAEVRAEIGTQDVYEAATDSGGIATLNIEAEHLEGWAKVIVEADNYQRDSILVKLAEQAPPSVVGLEPEGDAAAGTLGPQPPDDDVAPATESRPLADIPPAERADYFDARPEMSIDPDQSYRATIQTGKGDIVVSLDAAAAPEQVNNFVFLSRQGFYDGLTFHRVEPGFVIQGGDPLGSGNGGPGYTIPGEFDRTHIEGALAMARLPDQANPDRESSGSQFYITLAPTPALDGQYSVFGQVEKGMDVVRSIEVGDVIERVVVER